MLRVGIYDDEWEINISCFESGSTLLEAVDTLDVVFLDIDMPELDGIETGKKICEMNNDCKLSWQLEEWISLRMHFAFRHFGL